MCRNHHQEKMCRNHHQEKTGKTGKNRFEPEKSQGQIFQECQGQIPKVKWKNKNGKLEKTGLNRKKLEKMCGNHQYEKMCGMSGMCGM